MDDRHTDFNERLAMLVHIGKFVTASCPSIGLNVEGGHSVIIRTSTADGGGGITTRNPGSHGGNMLSSSRCPPPAARQYLSTHFEIYPL